MSDQEDTNIKEVIVPAVKSASKNASKSASKKEEPKIDFDSWFALRSGKIPAQHHKEILKADFKARKVGNEATMAEYDEALGKYGIKLD